MAIQLALSTASQEIPLGYFVDSTDGNTEETGLTIANTDIKLWKAGATTLANKNSGGATHISNGVYYCVLDATDTDTAGPLVVFVHVSGALPVRVECHVGPVNSNVQQFGGTAGTFSGGRPEVNTSHIAGSAVSTTTAQIGVNVVQISGDSVAADNLESYTDGTTPMPVNATQISGDATAADNAEAFFDGTGYAGTNNVIPTVTTATNVTTVNGLAAGVITATSIAADAITAAKVADGAIDRATFAADTGLQSIRSNTAQAGAAGTITLDASASATTDFYVGAWVLLTGGTGVGQARVVTAYNGTTKVATIAPNWATNPDNTSTFAVLPAAQVTGVQGNVTGSVASVTGAVGSVTGAVGSVTGSVGSVTGNVGGNVTGSVGSIATGGIAAASFAAGAIDAAAIAANAIGASELAADAVAEIADAVWDEALSGHAAAGSAGEALSAAGTAGDPWTTALPGAYGAGTAGYIIGTNINATVSSRASQTSVDTIDDFLDTEVAAILADTNELQTDWVNGGRLDLLIDAIKAKTDNLPADPADASDIAAAFTALNDLDAGEVATAVWNAATATYGAAGSYGLLVETNLDAAISTRASQTSVDTVDDFLDTEVAAILAAVDTEVAAIKAKTDNLPAAPAATGDIPTAVQNADALLGRTISGGANGGRDVTSALRMLRNKTAIATGTLTVYQEDDTTSAWTATVATTAGDPISSVDPA